MRQQKILTKIADVQVSLRVPDGKIDSNCQDPCPNAVKGLVEGPYP